MSTAADDAESVDQFLARIASLKDRKDREDEERIRKMEEEIIQGREERKARRAERARSISPAKSSPAPNSSIALESRNMTSRSIDPPVEFTPPSQTQTPTRSPRMEPTQSPRFSKELTDVPATRSLPTPPQKSSSTPAPTPPTATSLARNGTLSWQQRPSSRDSNVSRPRPFAGSPVPVAALTADISKNEAEEEMSRSQIAKSLGAKDPTFFRQTADRGLGSAAYRRNESDRDSESLMSSSIRLPGIAQEHSKPSSTSPSLDSEFAKPHLPMHNVQSTDLSTKNDLSSTSSATGPPPRHVSPQSTPKLEPTTTDVLPASRGMSTDESKGAFPGWGSSRRPPSPTKGLGGFVESAMMKRSDSVSKRWSVQAAPGLKRGDSVASSRGGMATGVVSTQFNPSGSPPRQTRPIRPLSSSSTGSRPNSSHDMSSGVLKLSSPAEMLASDEPLDRSIPKPKTKALDSKDHSESRTNSRMAYGDDILDQNLPASPTKAMDSRRWSPTKSTWLESALARPESPKPLPSKLDEPAWKSNMHKVKTSIGSPPPANFEVNTTSLLRSPPMGGHSRPLSISGLPESFSSGMVKKSPEKSKPATIAEDLKPKAAKPETTSMEGNDTAGGDMMTETQELDAASGKSAGESDPFVSSPTPETKRASPPAKKKPAAPPKTDFRSALKPRQAASSDNSNDEPEFKAVFGKLKRTQTKNYIAPDELKDNITRGKAGLSLTGGPQKTKRIDEFKESILQKKEAMKEGTGLVAKPVIREKPAPIVPEALAKKEAMKAGNGPIPKPFEGDKSSAVIPVALAKKHLLGKSSGTVSGLKATQAKDDSQLFKPVEVNRQPDTVQQEPEPTSKYEVEKRSPPLEEVSSKPIQQSTALPKQELTNSKLASRLNPALASFLSRGPSPKPSTTSSPAASTEDLSLTPRGLSRKATNESADAEGTTLTHMTKARAKGPKRRTPRTQTQPGPLTKKPAKQDSPKSVPASLPAEEGSKDVVTYSRSLPTSSKPEPASTKGSTPKPLADILKVRSQPVPKDDEPKEAPAEPSAAAGNKPPVVAKSPELRKVSAPTPKPAAVETPPSPVKDRMRAFDIAHDQPKSPANKPAERLPAKSIPSGASSNASPLAPSTTRLNSPRSLSSSSDVSRKPPVTKSAKPVNGLGLNLATSSTKEATSNATQLTPPPEKPQPLSAKQSLPTEGTSNPEHKLNSKLRGGYSTKAYFTNFFDQAPKARDKADFDTQAIMSPNPTSTQKSKTLSTSIWEITANGKKESMTANQEHILFADSMYLCVHSFQPEKGSKQTEAHLWVGDAVSEAAVEDAQLFCRKMAKDHGAKLEVLQQGKETASFFQALGGILITRRNKQGSLYMLCGRRHLGHVSFDEVDMDARSLCSGFPFIVSAKFGKLFLWKGRGSGADELGCARLIGMDLGLTGEIEEINEGKEPKVFWESFSSKSRSQSSDLWDLKATQDNYACRLYRVEMGRPKSATGFWGRRGSSPTKEVKASVEEIEPFCQGDLSPGQVYVLDAYFEIYVYVGDQASSKTTEFVTALMLAQEMSMLAPTLQDRPLMPVCYLVFGDPPADFKATLRKWEDEHYAPGGSMVAPLEEAIEALD